MLHIDNFNYYNTKETNCLVKKVVEFPTLLIKQHVIKGILKIVMSIGGVL